MANRYQWINPLLEDPAPAPAWLLLLMAPERTVNGSRGKKDGLLLLERTTSTTSMR
jgi:hypothetical protein